MWQKIPTYLFLISEGHLQETGDPFFPTDVAFKSFEQNGEGESLPAHILRKGDRTWLHLREEYFLILCILRTFWENKIIIPFFKKVILEPPDLCIEKM